jgi:sec-independent protein translocase protein TatA
MPNITELFVILFIVFLLFGVSKLPEAGKSLGEGIKNFKKAISSGEKSVKEVKVDDVK